MIKFYENKFIIFCLILAISLCSGHALQTIYSTSKLSIFLAIFFIIPVLLTLANKKVGAHTIVFLLLLSMIFIQIIVGLGSGISHYFSQICIIVAAFGFVLVYPFDKFVSKFLKLMTIVTVIALIGYILLNAGLLSFLPVKTNINGVKFGVGFVYNFIVDYPERNCGLFWEPGLFATFLTLAILFEIVFKKEKISWWRLGLFAVAMLTANSSAGFMLLFMCLLLFITLGAKRTVSAWKSFLSFFVFLIGLFAILNLDWIIEVTGLINNSYFKKLLSDNVVDSMRVNAIRHNLEIFLEYPLGAGIDIVLQKMEYIADTSSFTYILSVYGFLGIVYTLAWIYGIVKIEKLNLFSKITILCIMIIILNKEPHLSLLFSWVLMFYLLKECNMPKKRNDFQGLMHLN